MILVMQFSHYEKGNKYGEKNVRNFNYWKKVKKGGIRI